MDCKNPAEIQQILTSNDWSSSLEAPQGSVDPLLLVSWAALIPGKLDPHQTYWLHTKSLQRAGWGFLTRTSPPPLRRRPRPTHDEPNAPVPLPAEPPPDVAELAKVELVHAPAPHPEAELATLPPRPRPLPAPLELEPDEPLAPTQAPEPLRARIRGALFRMTAPVLVGAAALFPAGLAVPPSNDSSLVVAAELEPLPMADVQADEADESDAPALIRPAQLWRHKFQGLAWNALRRSAARPSVKRAQRRAVAAEVAAAPAGPAESPFRDQDLEGELAKMK